MQRKIKFRGQKIDTKEWVYGYFITNRLGWCFIVEDWNINKFIRVITESIGQFTGLCDKNSKEIYEGDILGREGCWNIKILYNEETSSFGWECTIWVVTQGKIGEISKKEAKLHKVIGNIYENPELLEQEVEE